MRTVGFFYYVYNAGTSRGENLKAWIAVVVTCALLTVSACAQSVPADSDEKLSADFWAWRARYGQYTTDDINRMERPAGVVRDWSAASVETQRKELAAFEGRWKKLDDRKAPGGEAGGPSVDGIGDRARALGIGCI